MVLAVLCRRGNFMLTMFNAFDALKEGLIGFLLMIDGVVYWLIGIIFDLFVQLAGVTIFTQATYHDIAERFLTIIGVAMLFYLTYSLLKALVNPDELNKSTSKVAMNVIISLILIAIIPTIFDYAFRLQNAIIEDHIIDNLVFGTTNTSTISSVGKDTAMIIFDSFITDHGDTLIEEGDAYTDDTYQGWKSLRTCIKNNELDGCDGDEGFRHISLLAPAIVAGDIDYTPLISTICGCVLLYIIISFTLDMGVRVIKLGFFQIISPIPIMFRILPEKKSVFDNWVKKTMATFLEVFIRMFIMYILVFFCNQIAVGNISLISDNLGLFGNVVIIMGIFAFGKEAPKLISDVIGIDSGNMKLGIGGKLAAGGAFGLGAAAVGGLKTFAQNVTHAGANFHEAKGFRAKLKAAGSGVLSAGAGLVSGGVRGGMAGHNAKNFSDMRKAIDKGVQGATGARDQREAYRASHGGLAGAILGHAEDAASSVGQWFGIGSGLDALKQVQTKVKTASDARKAIDDRLASILEKEKNERKLNGTRIAGLDGKTYDNYADLLNDIDIMKSTGKYNGRNITGADLTAMANAESKMKKAMKEEILAGFTKNGVKDISKYDGELKELVTSYRTKVLQNFNTIQNNIEDITTSEFKDFQKQIVSNQDQNFEDYILSGNMLDAFNVSKDILTEANTTVNTKIASKMEQEAKKKDS